MLKPKGGDRSPPSWAKWASRNRQEQSLGATTGLQSLWLLPVEQRPGWRAKQTQSTELTLAAGTILRHESNTLVSRNLRKHGDQLFHFQKVSSVSRTVFRTFTERIFSKSQLYSALHAGSWKLEEDGRTWRVNGAGLQLHAIHLRSNLELFQGKNMIPRPSPEEVLTSLCNRNPSLDHLPWGQLTRLLLQACRAGT